MLVLSQMLFVLLFDLSLKISFVYYTHNFSHLGQFLKKHQRLILTANSIQIFRHLTLDFKETYADKVLIILKLNKVNTEKFNYE